MPKKATGASMARTRAIPGGSLGDPPLRMEEQGGGPRRWLSPNRGWLVSGQDAGPRRRRQAPHHHKPAAGQRAPPLTYQAWVTGSLGSCPGNWKPSLHPRGPPVFPRTTLPSRTPTPAEAARRGKTWGPGAGAGGGQTRFRASCSGPGWAERTPTDAFSRGNSGLHPT